MDQNLKTLNPVNMSMTAHTHQNFNPPIESGGGAVNFWPQLPIYNQQSTNVSHVEDPSFKKPRISQTMNSRMPVLINKSILGIPFKTELCLQFKRGHCNYGDNCHFIHGIGDSRRILPHAQELMTKESNVARNWNEDHRIITTMKLCRRFCNGEECPYGERCHFLHEGPAKFRKSFATSIGTTGPGGFSRNGCDQLECKTSVHSSLNANRVSQKSVLWKTRLCNNWATTGNCPFGVNCYFAHGHAELHKFGSQSAMEQGNVSTSMIISTAATHASLQRTGNGTACEQKIKAKKCLFKWRGLEKISRIYADWIEDMPLVHSSLGKVGS